jgi:uncharacterized protein
MKVNVAQLRRTEGGSEEYQFSENFPPLQLGNEEYIYQKPLKVVINVINTGKSLLARGWVQSLLGVNCSRCLKEISFPLDFEFEDEWLPLELISQDDEESVFIFEKDEFSIDERILEHILLNLPMRFMCSEECKGLCPHCGADLNTNPCVCSNEIIDPRLEILSKWNKGV